MAFKMKPKSPLTKKLVGKQHNLPDHLKKEILDAPETPMKRKGVRKGKTTDYRTKSTKVSHIRESKLRDKKLNRLNKRLSAKMSRQGTKVAERSTLQKKKDKRFEIAYQTAAPEDRKAYDAAAKRAQDRLREAREAREARNK